MSNDSERGVVLCEMKAWASMCYKRMLSQPRCSADFSMTVLLRALICLAVECRATVVGINTSRVIAEPYASTVNNLSRRAV